MKKIVFVCVFIFLSIQVFAENLDSLKAKRETLYQKYSEINIPGKELSDENLSKVVEILKDLVIVDTRIIKEYGDSDKELKENAIKIAELNSENETLNEEKESTTAYLFIIYIAGGIIVAILVLSLVILFVYYSKYSKAKKRQMEYSSLLKDADNERLKVMKANEDMASKEKEIEKLTLLVQSLKDEKTVLDGKIKNLEESVSRLQKTQQNPSPANSGDLEKINLNMAKIEKLGKMKELGIVTEEEFNTFKQKFLDEM
jgi:ATP-dependent Zn protease